MARLRFPDESSRRVETIRRDNSFAMAADLPAVAYATADEDDLTLADIRTVDGDPVDGSVLTVDKGSGLPDFDGPDGDVRVVFVSVNGGPRRPVYASTGAAVVEFGERVAAAEAAVAAAETPSGAQAKADAALASAISQLDARVVSLAAASGSDDTAAINAVLAASAGRVVRGRPGATYRISAPLVVYSGTTLDMIGCTVTAAGTALRMLQNASYGSATTRDSNITIRGGTWAAPVATGGDTHRIVMHRVDGVTVEGLRIESGGGKYALLLADVARFTVRDLDFAVASDGVHVTGPASDGLISRITGTTGDDFISLGCSDFLAYDVSRGDIRRVVVEHIYPGVGSAGNGVKLFVVGDPSITDTMEIADVSICDVKGSVAQAGITVNNPGDPANNASMRNIVIDNISVVTGNAFEVVRVSSAAPVRGLTISGVTIPAGAPANPRGVGVLNAIDALSIRGVRSQTSGRATGVVVSASVSRLSVVDARMALNTTDSRVCQVDAGTVGALTMSDVAAGGTANGNVLLLNGTGTVTTVQMDRVSYAPAGSLIAVQSPSIAVNFLLALVEMQTAGTLLSMQGAGASAVVRASGIRLGGTAVGLFISSGQVVDSREFGFPAHADRLAKTSNGAAYNTNSSLSCGVGPIVCNGTTWKHLYTGATY